MSATSDWVPIGGSVPYMGQPEMMDVSVKTAWAPEVIEAASVLVRANQPPPWFIRQLEMGAVEEVTVDYEAYVEAKPAPPIMMVYVMVRVTPDLARAQMEFKFMKGQNDET
jgi:hypothetical protein